MRMRRRRSNGGFTLAEVTMATLLVAVALVALMAAFYSGLVLVESSRNMAQASSDARTVFEEMRRISAGGTGPVVAQNWSTWASRTAGLTVLPNELITVTFRNPAADPVEATVTVSWTERTRNRSNQWTGFVTKR